MLTVGEAPEAASVPDLVGLSYPEAENKLEEAGFLLGGVKEEPSNTVPAGVIIKLNPPPRTALDPNSFVYLTTSVGPPDSSSMPTATPTASSSPSPALSGTAMLPIREENKPPNLLVNGNLSGIYYSVASLPRRDHPEEGFTPAAGAQYTN